MHIANIEGSLQVVDIVAGGPAAVTRQIFKGDLVVSAVHLQRDSPRIVSKVSSVVIFAR